ncbi:uncharacterized protein LOC142831823 [Microtus pennsylvanicus]|uniref:uncharacterized protein LOC142831823 n=1 Tax=Microtus pennsylvanicus TaxID=10058 RepID=UPI003F6C36C6
MERKLSPFDAVQDPSPGTSRSLLSPTGKLFTWNPSAAPPGADHVFPQLLRKATESRQITKSHFKNTPEEVLRLRQSQGFKGGAQIGFQSQLLKGQAYGHALPRPLSPLFLALHSAAFVSKVSRLVT